MFEDLEWHEPPVGADDTVLFQVERLLGFPVPKKQRELLQELSGGVPVQSDFIVRGSGEDLEGVIGLFLSASSQDCDEVDSLLEVLARVRGRLRTGLLPFASDGGGDLMCLDLSAKAVPVVYWHHEREGLDDEYSFIAPSIESFIAQLTKPDIEGELDLD